MSCVRLLFFCLKSFLQASCTPFSKKLFRTLLCTFSISVLPTNAAAFRGHMLFSKKGSVRKKTEQNQVSVPKKTKQNTAIHTFPSPGVAPPRTNAGPTPPGGSCPRPRPRLQVTFPLLAGRRFKYLLPPLPRPGRARRRPAMRRPDRLRVLRVVGDWST